MIGNESVRFWNPAYAASLEKTTPPGGSKKDNGNSEEIVWGCVSRLDSPSCNRLAVYGSCRWRFGNHPVLPVSSAFSDNLPAFVSFPGGGQVPLSAQGVGLTA